MVKTPAPPRLPAAKPHDAAASAAVAADHPRVARQKAVADVRRASVLAAARSAFFERGLEGASLREIAKRAGYSPAAIYSYFESKEEVYGALLGESLERLNAHVAAAGPAANRSAGAGSAAPQDTVRAKATAFFDFYREHPRDLDLGFYLFQGMQPRGLTPALNERLNAALHASLVPTHDGLVALGLTSEEAQTEVTALFAHCVGLLLLSHTGRIRMFRQDSQTLFERYLDSLMARASALATSNGASA